MLLCIATDILKHVLGKMQKCCKNQQIHLQKKKQQQQTGEEHKFLHVSSGKQWILRCKQWVLKNVLAFAVLYQMKIRR